MKFNILILCTNQYERDGVQHSRLGYIFTDKEAVANTQVLKGYREQSAFYEGTKVFDSITLDMIFKQAVAYVKEVPYPGNPMRTRKVIERIECNGKVVDLL